MIYDCRYSITFSNEISFNIELGKMQNVGPPFKGEVVCKYCVLSMSLSFPI